MADWYTLETIRADWRDAPSSDTVLQQLLDASKQQVLAFDNGYTWRKAGGAQADYTGDYRAGAVPSNLVMAQRMQVRNLWNASQVDASGNAGGEDTFVIRPFPLDWVIRQVIRPKTVPVVG